MVGVKKNAVVLLRDRHQLTQARLGAILGVRTQQVQKWEYDEDNPSCAARAAMRFLDTILNVLDAKRLPRDVREQLEGSLDGAD